MDTLEPARAQTRERIARLRAVLREHAVDALDRVASVLRRQRVRAEAFTAVASHDRATVQATIMFDSSGRTAARIVALLQPLLHAYAKDRHKGERFGDFAARVLWPEIAAAAPAPSGAEMGDGR